MTSSAEQQHLEYVLLGTRAGTWVWTIATGELVINERWAEIVGCTRAELAPVTLQTWQDLVHPDDRDRAEALLQRHLSGEDPFYECDLRVRHRDGRWIWVQDRGKVAEWDTGGRPARMYGTYMDITAHKQAELDREELLARLQHLSANIPGFIYQYRLRSDGSSHFPYASDGIVDIYGCTPESVREDAGPVFAVLHPDDRDGVVARIRASADTLAPWHDVYRVLHPRRGERWIEGNATPTRNDDGSITWHGYLRDVTQSQIAQRKLRLAASVFTSSQEGIMITDARRLIVDVNPAFSQITGYLREEAIGRSPSILKSGRQSASFYEGMNESLQRDGKWKGEIWNRRKNGEIYAELLSIDALRNEEGEVVNYVGVFTDINRLKEHEQELTRIAHYDPLTDLPNRRLLDDRLRIELSRARRSGHSLAVCYLDLDGFKTVNDAYGHDVGDRLLTTVSARIRDALRDYDTIARLGGDEFVVLMADLHNHQECFDAMERILKAAARPVTMDFGTVAVSASIGVTLFPEDDADADTLLRHADQAMYAAKQAGRNRFQLFDANEDRRVRSAHALLTQVDRGLQCGEFRLHYQPKVDLRDGRVIGVEALVRWQHPDDGLLLPGRFLPSLHRTRQDRQLGEWVIGEALRQHLAWRQAGLVLSVGVNVSGQHLLHRDFVPGLQEAFALHPGADPHDLEIEILESTELDDLDLIAETLARISALGVQLALDDFGTGYSSLTYLRRLPVQTIKIDQSFVRDMLDDPEDTAIVEGVIGLARSFGRQVVAEGVETDAHCRRLQAMGCHLVQGYGISPPLPAESLPGWIAAWAARHAATPG